jgi:ParB family transcriptional regulator, chromosome partitioning protein
MTGWGVMTGVSPTGTVMPIELARRLSSSRRLARRRFELLPLTGPGAAFTEVQGRQPGPTTAPADLAELISSIGSVGMLQPILVEELADGDRRVVAGERRLRAAKWGAINDPANPHFGAVPAVVCPGPLSEEERRIWQLVENLAREDLQPGELAAALLYERCGLLLTKLLAAGVPVPAKVSELEDPVLRFRTLDRLRLAAGKTQLGAPWEEVLRRLGLHLNARRVADMVHAFAELPADLVADMDHAKIRLATRLEYLQLDRGRRDAAAELWAAVKARGQPQLLAAAVREQRTHPNLTPTRAVDAAEAFHAAANQARRRAQQRRPDTPADHSQQSQHVQQSQPQVPAALVDQALVDQATSALRQLLAALRGGARLETYDAGSLALFAQELAELLHPGGSLAASASASAGPLSSPNGQRVTVS